MFLKEYDSLFLNNNSILEVDCNELLLFKDSHYQNSKNTEVLKRDTLNLYFAGIGMNSKSFLMPFQHIKQELTGYTVAFTLMGFKNNHKEATYTNQINCIIEEVEYLIKKYNKLNQSKRINNINLFGFSYGADILCLIAQSIKRSNNNIKINNMTFSDINLNKYTAFLTQRIHAIDGVNALNTSAKKRAKLIEDILENIEDENIVISTLEYFRMIYPVPWNNLNEIATYAYSKSDNRINELVNFAKRNTTTNYTFYISNKIEPDNIRIERLRNNPNENNQLIEQWYLKEVQNKINETLDSAIYNIKFNSCSHHFDTMSLKNIKKVNHSFK